MFLHLILLSQCIDPSLMMPNNSPLHDLGHSLPIANPSWLTSAYSLFVDMNILAIFAEFSVYDPKMEVQAILKSHFTIIQFV